MGAILGCLGSAKKYELCNRTVKLKGHLGEGAFSVVQLVTDTRTGTEYALKVIKCTEADEIENAEKEAFLYETFNHKNVIQSVDRATERASEMGGASLVLILFPAYKRGSIDTSLLKMKEEGKFYEEAELLLLFRGICEGLEMMHTNDPPYAHRDLKPANVLISDDGTPILMDFGSVVEGNVKITNRKEALKCQGHAEENATLPYRAPELFNVSSWPSEITLKADIWSLGCVLYTMAYGETPFEMVAGQTGSVALAIAQGKFHFPDNDPYSDRVHNLIESMLNLNPVERPTIGQVLGKVL